MEESNEKYPDVLKKGSLEEMLENYANNPSRKYDDGHTNIEEFKSKWNNFYSLIKNKSLPLDDGEYSWAKSDEKTDTDHYLANGFLFSYLKNKFFYNGARPKQYMMYQAWDKDKEDKKSIIQTCYNGYAKSKIKKKFGKDDIDNYEANIRPLLKAIVDAADSSEAIAELTRLETGDENYRIFSGNAVLRTIAIVQSIYNDKDVLPWIVKDKAIEMLAGILGTDYDETSFYTSASRVYERAKDLLSSKAEKLVKETDPNKKKHIVTALLNKFLWDLQNGAKIDFTSFASPNIILCGAPGTGKTFTVSKSIETYTSLNKDMYRDFAKIQFHPSYTYQDFIEGIKPMGIKDSSLDLRVVNGHFKDFCIKVREENENTYTELVKKFGKDKVDANMNGRNTEFLDKNWPHYFFVVDEINRGNLSNIFGETFTLLEFDYRDFDFSGKEGKEYEKRDLVSTALSGVVKNLPDNEKRGLIYKTDNAGKVLFGIPFNIHFIGMMNDVDKSIDSFDLALRRRFRWIEMKCDYEVIRNVLSGKYDPDSVEKFVMSCQKLNKYICEGDLQFGRLYEIGHAMFLKIRSIEKRQKISNTSMGKLFDGYISGTVKEYIRQLADESELDKLLKGAREVFVKDPEDDDTGEEENDGE